MYSQEFLLIFKELFSLSKMSNTSETYTEIRERRKREGSAQQTPLHCRKAELGAVETPSKTAVFPAVKLKKVTPETKFSSHC